MGQELNGWLVAAILFVLLVFRDAVKEWLAQAVSTLGEALYRRLAGNRLLRRVALARYRRGVASGFGEVRAPFAEEKFRLRDVYVPVTVTALDGKPGGQEAGEAIAEQLRTVVTGAPGAGKSALLRHTMVSWAETGEAAAVPVLAELSGLRDTGLLDELERQMRRHGFPGAGRFLRKALHDGQLTVLLDGFDEVSADDKPRVAQLVADFAEAYPATRLVVTCRSAEEGAKLLPEPARLLRLGELDDRAIRRFLGRWPAVKGPQRVQQLMETLRDNPRALHLARNPLQLTMICFLHGHADNRRQLPQSRAQLAAEATSLLLRGTGGQARRFEAAIKHEVLQQAALAGLQAATDRRALSEQTMAGVAAERLPAHNESAKDAQLLLDEMTRQTALLERTDGGGYRFAHLALQEYFAARELSGDLETMRKRLHADPARWSQTAKWWCGLTAKDTTKVVSAALRADLVSGLECLAGAKVVKAELAHHIIEESLSRLAETGDRELVTVLGMMAADPRPQGGRVYDRLAELAGDGDLTAAAALAETNLPKAALVLSAAAAARPEARPALVRMGELAVPALSGYAAGENGWAVDCLAEIATPGAIEALVEQLWAGPASRIAIRAAWRLATLTEQADVLAVLRTATKPTVRLGGYDWCWEPFAGPAQGSLPEVMAQICLLLDQPEAWAARPEQLPPIDPRIGIPLCLRQVEKTGVAELKPMRENLLADGRTGAFQLARRRREHVAEAAAVLSRSDDSGAFVALSRAMAPAYQQQVTMAALTGSHFTRKDWAPAPNPRAAGYRFAESARYRLLFAGVCLMLLAGLGLAVGIVSDWWPAWGPSWWGWLALAFLLPSIWVLAHTRMASTPLRLRWGVLGLLEYGESIMDGEGGDRDNIMMGVFGAGFALSVVLLIANGQNYLGWPATLALTAAALSATVWLWISGGRKEALTYSPLARLLPTLR